MLLFVLSLLVTLLGEISPQKIEPLEPVKQVSEGDPVTLSCSYSGGTTGVTLQWYRQYLRSRPEFLLLVFENNVNSDPNLPRMSAKATKTEEQSRVDLLISSVAVSDSALYYCTMEPDNAADKVIFGKGTKLTVMSEKSQDPVYYRYDNKNVCLATNFTAHDQVNKWPVGASSPEAVRFTQESYYSRISYSLENCTEPGGKCKNDEFYSDEKSNFLAFSIFWMRVLFFKTIVINVLMTIKVWIS